MSLNAPQGSFAQHLAALRQQIGDVALDVRHELFFLAAGNRWWAGWRGCAALLRDTWMLLRSPVRNEPQVADGVLLLATLTGANGWGTLARSLSQVVPGSAAVLAHPRLASSDFPSGLPVLRPLRPSLADVAHAVLNFFRVVAVHRSLLLASCLARRGLWRASLARTLSGRRGPLVLHNDFDMMSNAATAQGIVTVCLQHGLPTDEFFPTRADWYVVWGARSRQAFGEAGSNRCRLVEDALGRVAAAAGPTSAPTGLSLLSQTHAPILGGELAEWLREIAATLQYAEPELRILLHPQEQAPYAGAAARACTKPPHVELVAGAATRLVLGCCTTALFDAALAGHWVVRLVAPIDGNQAALKALEGPLTAASAAQALALYRRLRHDPAFRREAEAAQRSWLRENFTAQTDGFARLLSHLQGGNSGEGQA